MGAQEKTKLVGILQRCSDVIDGEMELLRKWAGIAQSSGRASRCTARRGRIQSGPSAKMAGLLSRAKALPPEDVKVAPTPQHDSLVRPNETSLRTRSTWNVNKLSDPMFSRALDRAEENSADSVKDATAILADCTR